ARREPSSRPATPPRSTPRCGWRRRGDTSCDWISPSRRRMAPPPREADRPPPTSRSPTSAPHLPSPPPLREAALTPCPNVGIGGTSSARQPTATPLSRQRRGGKGGEGLAHAHRRAMVWWKKNQA